MRYVSALSRSKKYETHFVIRAIIDNRDVSPFSGSLWLNRGMLFLHVHLALVIGHESQTLKINVRLNRLELDIDRFGLDDSSHHKIWRGGSWVKIYWCEYQRMHAWTSECLGLILECEEQEGQTRHTFYDPCHKGCLDQ